MDGPSLLPELTRSLRALGSETGPGRLAEWQLAYFSPLLEARRRAVECGSVAELVACFDAVRVERDLGRSMTSMAAEVAGSDAPLRRATEALLEEALEPLVAALQHFRSLSAEVGEEEGEGDGGKPSVQLPAELFAALTAIYRCADDRWDPVKRVLMGSAP
jgi:hypothetical protein